ncbi:peptide-N-glycosidase F-related protein [Sandaracinus amylolyticus]|uniref:N-glycosidase F, putative n=1 Tax=Sandaracinus amylolyticus TaxID=927083 RepID=A0A0F6WA47_9BACT|nr:peptide-N-glycosidase F-related protein [Sandaracinus amylolyticus]AKF11298.1 N-glycosidase F, putative [Sandaracinus amylolyticus]
MSVDTSQRAAWLLVCLLATACGDDDASSGGDAGETPQSDAGSAPTEPLTVVAMDGEHVHFTVENRRRVNVEVDFPPLDQRYGEVIMHFALRCPPEGGCDWWDRRGALMIVENPGVPEEEEQRIEISRFVTPYRVGAAWDVDVTDLRPLLSGRRTLQVFIDTWVGPGHANGAGWLVDVSFEHRPGVLERRAIAVVPVFRSQQPVYGDPARSIPSQVPPVTLDVPAGASALAIRSFITGHGQGNAENCAEFCPRDHTFSVEGQAFTRNVWRDDCATTAAPGQAGTYTYPRAGWCPGAVTHDWSFDVPLPSDGTVDVGYDVATYENSCRPGVAVCSGCTLGTGCEYDGGAHAEPHYDLSALLIAYE